MEKKMNDTLQEVMNEIERASVQESWDIDDDNNYLTSLDNNMRIYINPEIIKLVLNRTGGNKTLFVMRKTDGYQELIDKCVANINKDLIRDAYTKLGL
jgi:hypothetical protein